MTTRKTRFSLLALAATAALATTALAPTDASAFGRFGGYHFGHGGYHFGGFHRFGWRYPGYHFGHYGWYNHYRFGWRYPGYYRWWGWNRWYRWHPRPIIIGGVGAVGAVGGAAVASAPAMASGPAPQAQPSNCLVKQYLQNGAVAFADTCTNEQAVAMPNGGQPGQGAR